MSHEEDEKEVKMKLTDKSVTAIIIITTLLWVIINILGWLDHYILGMYLGVILMLLYMVLGVSRKGEVSKKLLLYPLLTWAVLWIISFYLADVYSLKFAGVLPDFTILGMHPSFAPVVFLYWIGGMLTLTLGFIFLQDEWMTSADWDEFLEKVEAQKKEEREAING